MARYIMVADTGMDIMAMVIIEVGVAMDTTDTADKKRMNYMKPVAQLGSRLFLCSNIFPLC